jgi:hypothetical protein
MSQERPQELKGHANIILISLICTVLISLLSYSSGIMSNRYNTYTSNEHVIIVAQSTSDQIHKVNYLLNQID